MTEPQQHWQSPLSSRARIVNELRCGDRTIDDLSGTVGITHNAVRLHLQALERDGLVRLAGTRQSEGAGKPAYVYEIVPGADERFSRAYAPVLGAVLNVLADDLDPEEVESILRRAGRALGAQVRQADTGSQTEPDEVERAVRLVTGLGGRVEVERRGSSAVLRGCGCVLSAVARAHPAICRAVETLLSEATGARVREECERGDRVNCRFTISPPDRRSD